MNNILKINILNQPETIWLWKTIQAKNYTVKKQKPETSQKT